MRGCGKENLAFPGRDDDDSFPLLGNAVIRHVDDLNRGAVPHFSQALHHGPSYATENATVAVPQHLGNVFDNDEPWPEEFRDLEKPQNQVVARIVVEFAVALEFQPRARTLGGAAHLGKALAWRPPNQAIQFSERDAILG